MSLLNSILAFGALAFTIPLVIHLIFRSRYRTIDWGAMYLLESVVRQNRRRMQITNLLLLLLRCLIPVLLAFCLARPVWNGLRALAMDAPKTLVIAIDDSRSMSTTPPGAPSRIELAKQQIRSILDDVSRRDEVILVRSSRLGAVPSKMGVSDALVALRKIDAQGNSVSLGNLLDAAISAAEEGSHPRRQILMVSDFQNASLDMASIEYAKRVAVDYQSEGQGESANQLVIDLLNVSADWDELTNLSVESITIDSPVVTEKRSAVYSATIRNRSDLPARDLRLVWSIDGKDLDPRVVTVDANSTATNRLSHGIDTSGVHQVSVSIDRSDVLMADNRRSIAVDVISEVDVILVEGKPDRQALRGQADYLAIALSPFAFGGDDRPDPVRASVVTTGELSSKLDGTQCRVIVLAGVGQLPDSAKAQIADFVHAGGSLLVFDGPPLSADLYNSAWSSKGSELRFPARLGSIKGDAQADATSGENAFDLDRPLPLYQPWRILARADENPFSGVRVTAYRELDVREDSDDAQESIVVLRTTNGDPIVVMQGVGEGTVVQFAISGNDAWSTLPLRPVFLPMIQQLVLDLAGKQTDSTIAVGTPIVVADDSWPASSKPPRSDVRYTARTPGGEYEIAAPSSGEPIRLTATYLPGLYEIEKRVFAPSAPEQAETFTQARVASVNPAESLLMGATEDRINAFAEVLGATVFREATVLRSADRSRSFGYEIWRWLLAALLIAMVAELWLQQNLVRRRSRTGGAA